MLTPSDATLDEKNRLSKPTSKGLSISAILTGVTGIIQILITLYAFADLGFNFGAPVPMLAVVTALGGSIGALRLIVAYQLSLRYQAESKKRTAWVAALVLHTVTTTLLIASIFRSFVRAGNSITISEYIWETFSLGPFGMISVAAIIALLMPSTRKAIRY